VAGQRQSLAGNRPAARTRLVPLAGPESFSSGRSLNAAGEGGHDKTKGDGNL
jgi:hypothetical protein